MRSIKFTPDEIQSIREGRKTQARKPMKGRLVCACMIGNCSHDYATQCVEYMSAIVSELSQRCPYGKAGSLLVVQGSLVIRIESVRTERLQKISDQDAISEGARKFDGLPSLHPYKQDARWSLGNPKSTSGCLGSPRYAFANVWESQHKKEGFRWVDNPWVWVFDFVKESV